MPNNQTTTEEPADPPVVPVTVELPAIVAEDIANRVATRDLKHFLVKLMATGAMFLVIASVLTLLYSAIVQDKDLDTGFIGDIFKTIVDFIRFLLT